MEASNNKLRMEWLQILQLRRKDYYERDIQIDLNKEPKSVNNNFFKIINQ